MCGICGILRFDGLDVDRSLIQRMNDAAAHRGPDGDGVFIAPGVGLGHRRLAILDLNPRGRQPMAWDGGRYQIVFNGEIYNYLEIRQELERHGLRFATETDTEVILAAYATWGEACLDRFNGMWAFAIFDTRERSVFIARDRFGVKPLYYHDSSAGTFAFASEIKQLLVLMPFPRANQAVVLEWMLTSFEDHRDETMFEGVQSLPGSHCMRIDLRTGRRTVRRWYRLQRDASISMWTEGEAIDRLRALLEDAVRLRLRSDVQVGTCLSGGLDSSAISAIASHIYHEQTGRRFLGVHARASERSIDESYWAELAAKHANVNLVTVTPSTDDFISTLDDVVRTQETPFGSASMFMGWHVFREARNLGCPVMLNGQGGDEVLLGYERYFSATSRGLRFSSSVLAAWNESRNSRLNFWDALRYKIYFLTPSLRIRHLRMRSFMRPEIQRLADFSFVERSAQSFRDLFEMQRMEIEAIQLPHLLRYEDRNSMRHGIETRLPFLDFRIVEAGVSMPVDLKIRSGWSKYVLRRATSNLLPENIVWRRVKIGFEAPMKMWLDRFRPMVIAEGADSRIIAETCDRRRLLQNWDALSPVRRWPYFNLACWERVFGVQWS